MGLAYCAATDIRTGAMTEAEIRALLEIKGLASHTTYRFWSPSAAARAIVRLLFSRNYTPP
jgi:hypothetical protein